ncbi:hypothetical protein BC830DRAFT_292333 [Chytriomyces sp. MP71]|nr:hypothetical protein BC830DRAFT_292333 [Chytriomyces sp. MP71]
MFRSKPLPSVPEQEQLAQAEVRAKVAAAIDAATNAVESEVDWPSVFQAADVIKACYETSTPLVGATEAIRMLFLKLAMDEPVALNYTLTTLDALFKSCEDIFVREVAQTKNLAQLQQFLERPDIAPENRGQCLDMIGEWAFATEDPPEIRVFFEKMLGAGYRFSPKIVSRLAPGALDRFRAGTLASVFDDPTIPSNRTNHIADSRANSKSRHRIDQIPYPDRKKWVKHDCKVAENSTTLLLESIASLSPNDDITCASLARENFKRCIEIQYRLVKAISRVPEPQLLARLLAAHKAVNSALEQYNHHRLQFMMLNATAANAMRNPLLAGTLEDDDATDAGSLMVMEARRRRTDGSEEDSDGRGGQVIPPPTVPYEVWSGNATAQKPERAAASDEDTTDYSHLQGYGINGLGGVTFR